MNYLYLQYALLSFLLSIGATFIVRKVALKFSIVDRPSSERKIHKKETPLLGGIAIFIAFFVGLYFSRSILLSGSLNQFHWLGLFFGACFLLLGGILDDKYNLKPNQQIIWPILAIACVVAGGIGIEKITNPLGGMIYLDVLKIPIFEWNGMMHYFIVIADSFTILWLMGTMYTTKLLDGMDGLVTGTTAIGSFMIFLFTMTTRYYQPDVGLAALLLSVSCFGFLIFNWHPASIFLGESGSLLLGYILGVLAVISGGKIAMALLIMGIPILDVAWTILRRLRAGFNPFRHADRQHLHFRLFDLGIGQRKTVLIYYSFSLIFGLCALFLQSLGKVFALILLIILMIAMVLSFNYLDKRKTIN